MSKKLLPIIFCIVLIASLLAGCGGAPVDQQHRETPVNKRVNT